MKRWWAVGGAATLIAGAFAALSVGTAKPQLPEPPASFRMTPDATTPLAAPGATPVAREAKRFARLDADDNGGVSEAEYLASRRKAFAKLDVNADGKVDFTEYAAKSMTKFGTADTDHDGKLSASELATTAPKRNSQRTLERCRPEPNADA